MFPSQKGGERVGDQESKGAARQATTRGPYDDPLAASNRRWAS